MTFEIRAKARRAADRALGFSIVAGAALAGVLIPILARASSGSVSAGAALASFVMIGALVWIGGFALSKIMGFVASRAARRAATRLRASGVETEVEYARLAPETSIVALTARPGELGIWTEEDGELVALARLTQIQTIVLTAQRIWGFYYYALDIESDAGHVVVSLGTRGTWGMAEASRTAHIRLAEQMLVGLRTEVRPV